MMALENKETIQRSSEASLKCLQTNGFPYGNSNDGFPELKEEISVHSGGDVVEPVHSISSEFLELPSELHSKPTYHHDFGSRSTFYPDSKRCNQKEAVKMAGLAWQGRAHCGLDDQKHCSPTCPPHAQGYQKFSITNSPMWQTTDGSLSWKPSPDNLSFSLDQPYKLKEMHSPVLQYHTFCYCAVKNSKGMVRKPGPKQGSLFFGCGNWTATRGALCHYFEWAST
ncbi:hypothetical protein GH714_031241 [Hevea brasiliensis]|uniref:GRF-type domain-containing protein n=1 Tax=Hevea brasiliensis TaxID=3981 RepID=A0A6A6LCX1_HEVBR|nr:hypothetical protein GH714_031241 [Hevea brasiliensis]